MQEHVPSPHVYGPWWIRALVSLSVIAVLAISGITGVGVGIVFGAIALGDTAGIAVVTIVRAHRHNEPLRAAAVALLVGEYGSRRLGERSRSHAHASEADRFDPGKPAS